MKLATFRMPDRQTQAGVVHNERVFLLEYPTVLELLRDPEGLAKAQRQLDNASKEHRQGRPQGYAPTISGTDITNTAAEYGRGVPLRSPLPPPVMPEIPETPLDLMRPVYAEYVDEHTMHELALLSPVPEPPSVRDFYAFEQHVKAARAKRGVGMIPEWYEIPTFYFTNNSEIYGHDQEVPYPVGSNELDFELEIACVIGREGKDIAVEEATDYIAGYTVMNDWSARDFQRQDMKLNLGPGKGKDFATSLGPWLVTPDELAPYRVRSASGEESTANARYDMTMLARVNGKEISRGNFKDIYYSFPQMIAYASRNARLRVGDILGSGTVGTGCLLEIGTEVHPWFQRGDVIELEIEGIGVLRNRIV